MQILPIIFLFLIYLSLIGGIFSRAIQSLLQIPLSKNFNRLSILVEFIFTILLPPIGFIMLLTKSFYSSIKEVNDSSIISLSEQEVIYLFIFSGIGILIYAWLRLSYNNKKIPFKAIALLFLPIIACLIAIIWLGEQLLIGLIPIGITLPVISPAISLLYILLFIFQRPANKYSSSQEILDAQLKL